MNATPIPPGNGPGQTAHPRPAHIAAVNVVLEFVIVAAGSYADPHAEPAVRLSPTEGERR